MKAVVILFKRDGKYYTEEEWEVPNSVPRDLERGEPHLRAVIGPYDMYYSKDFRRIDGGAVLVPSQEPWGFPHLFPSEEK